MSRWKKGPYPSDFTKLPAWQQVLQYQAVFGEEERQARPTMFTGSLAIWRSPEDQELAKLEVAHRLLQLEVVHSHPGHRDRVDNTMPRISGDPRPLRA